MAFKTAAKGNTGRKACQRSIAKGRARYDLDQMTANVIAAYEASDGSGAHWYPTAHGIATDHAERFGGSVAQGAGVLAALSASTGWERNISLAETMWETNDCAHSSGNAIRKARAIRNGADPADILGGRKVRSFYANILRPDSVGPVTIDRHAFRIVLHGINAPHVVKTTDAEAKVLGNVGVYVLFAAAYRGAGRRLGVAPHVVQSVTWEWLRDQGAGIERKTKEGKLLLAA